MAVAWILGAVAIVIVLAGRSSRSEFAAATYGSDGLQRRRGPCRTSAEIPSPCRAGSTDERRRAFSCARPYSVVSRREQPRAAWERPLRWPRDHGCIRRKSGTEGCRGKYGRRFCYAGKLSRERGRSGRNFIQRAYGHSGIGDSCEKGRPDILISPIEMIAANRGIGINRSPTGPRRSTRHPHALVARRPSVCL